MVKYKNNNEQKPATRYLRTHKKHILIIFAAVLLLLVLIDISPYGGKNIQMYAKWIECGNRPLVVNYGGFFGASVQTYHIAPNFNDGGFVQGPPYFCNETEAQQAGYHSLY